MISYQGNVSIWGTDYNALMVVKVRNNWSCNKCSNPIPKGSYCFGKDYSKYCLNCGFIVKENFIKQLDKFSTDLKADLKEDNSNKQKYSENNMVENL